LRPSLIIHGGAWNIPDGAVEACRRGCTEALDVGWQILEAGGSALDAVEASIVSLENDPTFDAGTGAHLTLDGRVELDAILMNGTTLKAGAIAAVSHVKNPIQLARRVLEGSPHMMLVGAGAEQFAREQHFPLCDPQELVLERERLAWQRCSEDQHATEFHVDHAMGTVGAVAIDAEGDLFAGTSTGGTCCKHSGRVGDSPLIGCGCYADAQAGGVSCTGLGEAIMRVVLAKTAVEFLRVGKSAQETAQACTKLLFQRGRGTGGLILLDRNGVPGFAFNTSRMAFGYVAADGSYVIEPRQ
jgi:L-asparaginase / beta-aspartyl-peptidase